MKKECKHIWYAIQFGEVIKILIIKCGVCNCLRYIKLTDIERI